MFGGIMRFLAGALFGALTSFSMSAHAATVTYTDRNSFAAQLLTSDTDTFSGSVYTSGDSPGGPPNARSYTNAGMSAVRGETDFTATYFSSNYVFGPFGTGSNTYYCAGCNGSFTLGFTTTSLGTNLGVGGVGLDILFNNTFKENRYSAFVTFGDGSMQTYALPAGKSFFGIASDLLVSSINFTSSPTGGSRGACCFIIDNLTIGAAAPILAPIPIPAGLPLVLSGVGLLGLVGRRRSLFGGSS